MPNVNLLNQTGNKVAELTLSDHVFGIAPHQQALYDVVNAQRAAMRHGTHDVKNRGEVSGGGRKPWRQKGPGRARADRRDSEEDRPRTDREPAQELKRGLVGTRECSRQAAPDGQAHHLCETEMAMVAVLQASQAIDQLMKRQDHGFASKMPEAGQNDAVQSHQSFQVQARDIHP